MAVFVSIIFLKDLKEPAKIQLYMRIKSPVPGPVI
jgi:hypothetical protein